MSRKRKAPCSPGPRKNTRTPAIEIVRLSRAEVNAEARMNLKLEIAQIVEETVQQAMLGKGAELQPFFGSKEVAYEIKRRQTVHEQNKLTYYFEDWGCMICGSRKGGHGGCGMCRTCYGRVKLRIHRSLCKRQSAEGSIQPTFKDTMQLAREALAPVAIAPAVETQKTGSKT